MLVPSFEQPGDPIKAAQRIVDLLGNSWGKKHLNGSANGNGVANGGHKLPPRIALGDDAYGLVKEYYGKRLEENEQWKDWICGTNY